MNNILDESKYWKKAHVGETYYHEDAYALRAINVYDHRLEFWKFFPRTAVNSGITVLWFDEVRHCLEQSLFRKLSAQEVINESFFIACASLSRQELERDIMPDYASFLTIGNNPRTEERDIFGKVIVSYR